MYEILTCFLHSKVHLALGLTLVVEHETVTDLPVPGKMSSLAKHIGFSGLTE